MINICDIKIDSATKLIMSKLIEEGGICSKLSNTNIYIIKLNSREYFFKENFSSAIPYMYGVILSSKDYWSKILKHLKITNEKAWIGKKQIITLLVFENGLYNAVIKEKIKITGDGKNTLRQLIEKENLKRINFSDKTIFPIKTNCSQKKLSSVLKREEKIILNNFEYRDISSLINKKYVNLAKTLINFFPKLPYLCFELHTKNFALESNYCIKNIIISGGINVFFDLNKNGGKKNAAEEIIKRLL